MTNRICTNISDIWNISFFTANLQVVSLFLLQCFCVPSLAIPALYSKHRPSNLPSSAWNCSPQKEAAFHLCIVCFNQRFQRESQRAPPLKLQMCWETHSIQFCEHSFVAQGCGQASLMKSCLCNTFPADHQEHLLGK